MLKAKQIYSVLKKSGLAVDRGYQGEFEVGDGCLIYKDDADPGNPGWAYRHNRKMGGGSGPIDDTRDLKQFIAQVKKHSAKGGYARVRIEGKAMEVTDKQIQALGDEAGRAGDTEMVRIVRKALRGNKKARKIAIDAILDAQAMESSLYAEGKAMEVTDKQIQALGDEAGRAGDTEMVRIVRKALRGNKKARKIAIDAILDAQAMESSLYAEGNDLLEELRDLLVEFRRHTRF